jgi:hypothetical protein
MGSGTRPETDEAGSWAKRHERQEVEEFSPGMGRNFPVSRKGVSPGSEFGLTRRKHGQCTVKYRTTMTIRSGSARAGELVGKR